jgi:hypothetical protein
VLYDHVTYIDTQFDSFEAANDVAMERLDLYRAHVLALEYEELQDLPGDRCLWKAEWSMYEQRMDLAFNEMERWRIEKLAREARKSAALA